MAVRKVKTGEQERARRFIGVNAVKLITVSILFVGVYVKKVSDPLNFSDFVILLTISEVYFIKVE